ncbi:MAG: hypothetical protein JWM10_4715 [Myxococcaceae bacterium]|nr:hypothetical protein [Myxococcaceae bacterium]
MVTLAPVRALFGAALALSACSDPAPVPTPDAGIDAPAVDVPATPAVTDGGDRAVTIRFAARVGARPFRCGERYPLGTPAVEAEVVDLRFYVHDVRLVRADGTEAHVALTASPWQHQNVALLDFEDHTGACDQGDAETNADLVGTVAPGDYRGLRFRVGVPFAMNHTDLAAQPSPLNRSTLFWSWNSGHIFFAATTRAAATRPVTFDGGLADAAAPGDLGAQVVMNDHFTHVGSTGCMGNPSAGTAVTACAKPNRPELSFDAFDAATQRVVIDLAAVKEGSNLTANDGCHSFTPTCTPAFSHLGLDWSTGAPAATQTAFRVE